MTDFIPDSTRSISKSMRFSQSDQNNLEFIRNRLKAKSTLQSEFSDTNIVCYALKEMARIYKEKKE